MFRRLCRFALHRRWLLLFCFLMNFVIFLTLSRVKRNSSQFNSIRDRTVIFVRTSHYCQSRLDYLFHSWIPFNSSEQTNIFILTDRLSKYKNQEFIQYFPNFIESHCPETHNQLDLCCKTASEFEFFYELLKTNSHLQWMCRFDDDQYVNLNNLYKFLSRFDSQQSHYIGRISSSKPSRIPRRKQTYQFATYGAGVCFSRQLLDQLQPHVNKTIFPLGCRKLGKSDDGYVGYLVEFLLNTSVLSLPNLFHSHLEHLDESFRIFTMNDLMNTITFGFAWDRYDLTWLPVIHQLIELNNRNEKQAAENLWLFIRNYEKLHLDNLKPKYDQTCSTYQQRD